MTGPNVRTPLSPDREKYWQAVTEIYELRAALAHEARIVEASLDYATFPRRRRPVHSEQVVRMRAAARGDRSGYSGDPDIRGRRHATLRSAGAEGSLTNQQWEAENGWTS